MKCKEGDILHTYDYDDEFLILESGNASRKGRRYARGEYCIEVGYPAVYQMYLYASKLLIFDVNVLGF